MDKARARPKIAGNGPSYPMPGYPPFFPPAPYPPAFYMNTGPSNTLQTPSTSNPSTSCKPDHFEWPSSDPIDEEGQLLWPKIGTWLDECAQNPKRMSYDIDFAGLIRSFEAQGWVFLNQLGNSKLHGGDVKKLGEDLILEEPKVKMLMHWAERDCQKLLDKSKK